MNEIKIIGAEEIPTHIEIRDGSTPVEPQHVEIVQHEEVVIEDPEKARKLQRDPTAPEVRVRVNDGSFRRAINDQ